MNRRWFCSKSARDSTDSPASRCGKHGGGGNGQLHSLKHPQCSAYLPRRIAQEQCSSTGGSAGQHGRSDHRRAAHRRGGCHADRVLAAADPPPPAQAASSGSFPFDRQAWRLVALEWPRWGPRRALRARSNGNAHGRAPTQVHPSGCSHRWLSWAQQLVVATVARRADARSQLRSLL